MPKKKVKKVKVTLRTYRPKKYSNKAKAGGY